MITVKGRKQVDFVRRKVMKKLFKRMIVPVLFLVMMFTALPAQAASTDYMKYMPTNVTVTRYSNEKKRVSSCLRFTRERSGL